MPRSCSPSRASSASRSSGNSMKLRSNFWLISVQILHSGAVVIGAAAADGDVEFLPVLRRVADAAAGGLDGLSRQAEVSQDAGGVAADPRGQDPDRPALLPDLRQVRDARLRLGRDQNITGVLNVGDQTQIRPGLLLRVGARSAVGVSQELDRHRAEIDGAQARRISRRENFGHGGIRLVRRRRSRFADDSRSIGGVAVIANLHVVAVWLHRRLHNFRHRSPGTQPARSAEYRPLFLDARLPAGEGRSGEQSHNQRRK